MIDIFYEVYKRNKSAVLLLVGIGELEEKIKEKVNRLQLQDAVKFLGLREDIPEILQAMDVFVFPSLFEGLPVTLVEAQAAGLPCVVSEGITKEIQITEGLEYVSLEEKSEVWAQYILNITNSKKDRFSEIKKNRFDIYSNVCWLEKMYLREITL